MGHEDEKYFRVASTVLTLAPDVASGHATATSLLAFVLLET